MCQIHWWRRACLAYGSWRDDFNLSKAWAALSTSPIPVVAVMVDLGDLRLVGGGVQSDHGELGDRPLLSRAGSLGP